MVFVPHLAAVAKATAISSTKQLALISGGFQEDLKLNLALLTLLNIWLEHPTMVFLDIFLPCLL